MNTSLAKNFEDGYKAFGKVEEFEEQKRFGTRYRQIANPLKKRHHPIGSGNVDGKLRILKTWRNGMDLEQEAKTVDEGEIYVWDNRNSISNRGM